VFRRLLTILLPLTAVAFFAGGCSKVNNADVAARVNDAELSTSQLNDLIEAIPPNDATQGPNSGERIRGDISLWVYTEAVGAQLAADGTPLADSEITTATKQLTAQLADYDKRSDDVRTVLARYLATRTRLDANADGQALLTKAIEGATISINPRFGTLDPAAGVVALGGVPTPTSTPATPPTSTG
jgi:hypothetical protein